MILFLFSVLSLVFLVPILYFIPAGFSKKGKLTVLIISFLLSSFGLLAYGTLDLLKTISMLFVLIILITYLLNKRMGPALFEAVEETVEIDHSLETNELVRTFQSHSYQVHSPGEKIEKEETINILNVSQRDEIDGIERSASLENENDVIGITKPLKSENDEIEPLAFLENKNDEIEPLPTLENEPAESFQEDDDIYVRNTEMIEEIVPSSVEEEENPYLDDSLLLDFEKDTNDIYEKTDDQIVFDEEGTSKENIKNEGDYMAELEKIIMESELGHEDIRDEKIQTEFFEEQKINHTEIPDAPVWEEIELLDEEELPLNPQSGTMEEMIPSDQNSFGNEEEQIEENTAANEESVNVLVQEEQTLTQEEQKEPIDEAKEKMQRQMFQIMLSQIEIARKMIDKNKYEQLVKDYMHPGLPLSEYYTIASLLIQHYLSNKEFEKLKSLLNELEAKYVEFPIILQEIKFLQTHYFNQ